MASLQPVKSHGRTYWRIVESRRVGGKPRPVPLLYLGSADALLAKLRGAQDGSLRVRSFRHGDVAALKAAADELGVVATIDNHVQRSARGLSVGTTMLLAAIQRAIRPDSKRGFAEWAEGTSLKRFFPDLNAKSLTSQYFWDQMDCISLDHLAGIEDDLTGALVERLGVKLDTLFYDTTNFFTYIDSTNDRSELAARGHSKQHRFDLRQVNLALLVSRDGQIPLCSQVYEGNTADVRQFPGALTRIRERLSKLAVGLEDVTLVYDKGNNSRGNQAMVDRSALGYVASLVPTQHPDLLKIPVTGYQPIASGPLAGTPVLRRRETIWGSQRTVVLFVSEQLREGQIRGLEQHLEKRLKELQAWKDRLARARTGARNPAVVQRTIWRLSQGQHLQKVLKIDYDAKRQGADRLRFWVDEDARQRLETEVFGKRILITNRHEWSDEEILLAYRGQSHVEAAFRQMKDDEHLALRPQFHWTDHKVKVHTFICILALILARLIEHRARQKGFCGSLSHLLDLLGEVRLAMVLRPSGKRGGRPRCEWQLEDGRDEALSLYRELAPQE